jgi:uroporphyrin-III C-methyltransferase / precorrin-2 dehydrogenase / sirohydrochlorin ferrochelatase
MPDLLPVFLNLARRRVALVGGGRVAAAKLQALVSAGAIVTVVAPEVRAEIRLSGASVVQRRFEPSDLDSVWLVIAAATPEVNAQVARAAAKRRVFVNAVDDPANASAFLGGVVRRDGVTIAISTNGDAPAMSGLLREAIDAVLPRELRAWMDEARRQRVIWRRSGVPMEKRRPMLLKALNDLYRSRPRLHAEAEGQRHGTQE